MHQEKQLFHEDSQINKGLRLEVGGCLVGRTEERGQSRSARSFHTCRPVICQQAFFLSVSWKLYPRGKWSTDQHDLNHLRSDEHGNLCHSFRRLPCSSGWLLPWPQTRSRLIRVCPKRKEEAGTLEARGSRAYWKSLRIRRPQVPDLALTTGQPTSTLRIYDVCRCQAMNFEKLKAETQGCFWEVHCLVMEPGGDKCRHWARPPVMGHRGRVSSMFSIHPLV